MYGNGFATVLAAGNGPFWKIPITQDKKAKKSFITQSKFVIF